MRNNTKAIIACRRESLHRNEDSKITELFVSGLILLALAIILAITTSSEKPTLSKQG